MKTSLFVSLFTSTLLAVSASGTTLSINATADIFGAGHATVPSGFATGSLPPSYTFLAGNNLVLTFSSVTGTVSSGANTTGPDGAHGGPSTDMNSINGISGILDGSSGFFLVGIFENGSEPTDPAPGRLDFSAGSLTESFTSLAPGLNQTFYVGDGLTGTGSGTVQQFIVPAGATELFLGFADGNPTGINSNLYNYHGNPSYYSDNTGSLQATFAVVSVPEPSVFWLTALGLAGLAARIITRSPRD